MSALEDKIFLQIFYFFGYAIGFVIKGIIYLVKRAIFMRKMEPQVIDNFPLQSRLEHIHIVGGSGHGKNTIITTINFNRHSRPD